MRAPTFREVAVCDEVHVQQRNVSYHVLREPVVVDELPSAIGEEIVLALVLIVLRSPGRRRPTIATILDPDGVETRVYLREGKFSTGEQLFIIELSGYPIRLAGRHFVEIQYAGI